MKDEIGRLFILHPSAFILSHLNGGKDAPVLRNSRSTNTPLAHEKTPDQT